VLTHTVDHVRGHISVCVSVGSEHYARQMPSRTSPLRRLAILVVAVTMCTIAGWQLGRVAGPSLPDPGIEIPAEYGHNH
jgi:hypothetical protein